MSTFGQYVHLHWKNYEKYGTAEFNGRNNFQANVFKKHRNLIISQAIAMKNTSLKALETEYNNLNQTAYGKIKDALAKKPDLTLVLLRLINKSWSDAQIATIASSLEWNDATQSLRYTGSALQGSSGSSGDFKSIPTGTFLAKPLYTRIGRIKTQLQAMYEPELNPFEESLTNLQTYIQQQAGIMEQKIKIEGKIQNVTWSQRGKGTFNTAYNPGKYIADTFNSIMEKCLSAKVVNNILAYRLPEILGQAGTDGTLQLLESTLEEDLKKLITSTTFTEKTASPGMYFQLNEVELSNLVNSKSPLTKVIDQITDGKGNVIQYQIKTVGEGRQQKADIEWTIMTKDKQNPLGISMKATDLENTFSTPFIHLQSSSLMLYLLGLQNMQANLGTHYLNVFASHIDESNHYNSMRNEAEKSLTLAIVYSALTGKHQLRSGGQASILAIYDKHAKLTNGIPRIRFFDMGNIILNLNKQLDGVNISPDLSSIFLPNSRVEGNAPNRKLATQRITKIIVASRAETISASLNKNFLNNIYI